MVRYPTLQAVPIKAQRRAADKKDAAGATIPTSDR